MKTNHILTILAILGGISAAFTNHSKKNGLYPDWKFQKEQAEGKRLAFISAHHLADLIYNKEEKLILFDTRRWKAMKLTIFPIPSCAIPESCQKQGLNLASSWFMDRKRMLLSISWQGNCGAEYTY